MQQGGYTYTYPRPAVTVDAVLFTEESGEHEKPSLLLVQRRREPYEGYWAFPGGFVEINESLEEALQREVWEETGIRLHQAHQIGAYGDPERDPRGRTISVVYLVNGYDASEQKPADDAAALQWWPVVSLPALAFDHDRILEDGIRIYKGGFL